MALPWDPMWTQIVLGLLFLIVGSDYLVKSAVAVASRAGVSPLLIGLTLVGFGTSTPELVTSVQAALVHSPGIAIGNIVGSNIANILLIIGLSAVLMPVAAGATATYRDGVFVVFAAVALTWVCLTSQLTPQIGMVFLGLLAAYVAVAWMFERANPDATGQAAEDMGGIGLSLIVAVGALGLLILGASFFVDGSIQLARNLGLTETFIGLTLVAVGTSLPELFTSTVAAIRRQSDIAIGNILGSNIYNIFGILGVTALIHPLDAPQQIVDFDNFIMIGVSVLLLLWMALARGVGRLGGLVFLGLYVAYVYLIHPAQAETLQSIARMFTPLADMLRSIAL
jgi:cation:H+ antiporter